MLYVMGVMDVVFSVCTVMRGAVGARVSSRGVVAKRPRLRARRVKVRFSLRAIILSLENLNVIIRAIN